MLPICIMLLCAVCARAVRVFEAHKRHVAKKTDTGGWILAGIHPHLYGNHTWNAFANEDCCGRLIVLQPFFPAESYFSLLL